MKICSKVKRLFVAVFRRRARISAFIATLATTIRERLHIKDDGTDNASADPSSPDGIWRGIFN